MASFAVPPTSGSSAIPIVAPTTTKDTQKNQNIKSSPQEQKFYDGDDQDGPLFDQSVNFFPPQSTTTSSSFLLSSGGGVGTRGLNALANSFASLGLNNNVKIPLSESATHHHQINNTSYYTTSHYLDPFLYQSQEALLPQPLQYHLYTSPLPHVSNLHPHQKTIHAFFMSDHLREELQQKNEATLKTVNAKDYNLPEELHVYHSLCPLDERQEKSVNIFGYPTWAYKSVSNVDGRVYCLRRVEESWRRVRHANIVSIREAFTTKAFGDNSLVFVYDYHPLSQTLFDKHFAAPPIPTNLSNSQNGITNVIGNIPEKVLWSYITQLASAVKTIHSAGLAARVIEPTKILLTSKNRIRINCCGVMDMLSYDGGKNIPHYQLLISLACNSLSSVHNLPKSIDYVTRQYSPDFKKVILYLLSKPLPMKSIDDVIAMIGPRLVHEINSAHHYSDFLESELSQELENGRLVRLLCKFGFINERPEFDMDPSWSETGDRYLIKLFRDYVFHQVDENGYPVVNMAHVLTCLNKLDAGVDERIMLVSRDEQSCLIVSYKEIKNCIDSAFRDLSRKKSNNK
ncbi:1125_t:CDS:10 [Entrophospora sp. SA101]|nr:1125_t:CDS:10 [Entrophospora sp. SA101]